jgi:hypothetical protein
VETRKILSSFLALLRKLIITMEVVMNKKQFLLASILLVFCIFIGACGTVPQEELDLTTPEIKDLTDYKVVDLSSFVSECVGGKKTWDDKLAISFLNGEANWHLGNKSMIAVFNYPNRSYKTLVASYPFFQGVHTQLAMIGDNGVAGYLIVSNCRGIHTEFLNEPLVAPKMEPPIEKEA